MADNSRVTSSDHSDISPVQAAGGSPIRASDADRDKAATIISTAMAEGRLTPEEHSDRLDQIYAARTQADLVPLVQDLPVPAGGSRISDITANPVAVGTGMGARISAIFGGVSRKGAWRPSQVTEVRTIFGGAELDLREAVLPAREIMMRISCIFGGVELTVPPEMHVTDSGSAIFGGREICADTPESLDPDAPVLHLTGHCVFGGLEVRRKQRKAGKGARKSLPEL
jgi:hypothetical protein